ncbi:MAG: hypothetical protein KC636_11835 [Myxococcales bacterium]|nr:hypothetical protein [Myxococcales bacterium]
MQHFSKLPRLSAIACLSGLLLTQCDSGYTVYQVSSSNMVEEVGTCDNGSGNIDSTRTGGTAVIYDGLDGVVYLDYLGLVLEGAETDVGYEFTGSTVMYMDFGDGNIEDRVNYSVSITTDGKIITGTSVADRTVNCIGTCTAFNPETCKTTATFVGREVDAEIEHQI